MGVPGTAVSCYNKGCDLLKHSQYSEAFREFERAIELDSGLVGAYINLGNCLMKTGQEDKSLDYYRKAIDRDSRNTSAHFNYAIALFCLERYEDAAKEVRLAEELEPTRIDMQCTCARYYATIGETVRAFKYAFKAIRLQPGTLACYQALLDVVLLSCLNFVIRSTGRTHR
jgi:tetratricopeptide (TPR) repeat protein